MIQSYSVTAKWKGVLGVVVAALVLLGARHTDPLAVLAGLLLVGVQWALVVLIRRPRQEVLWWAVFVWGVLVIVGLRAAVVGLVPPRYEYPIMLDQLLAFGHVPTVWLQARSSGSLDQAMLLVHASYFVIPPLAAYLIWGFRPWDFSQYVMATILTYSVGLVAFAMIPTAPPWLASVDGHLPGVRRIIASLTWEQDPEAFKAAALLADSNPVAAMPSLHAAATVIVALALSRTGSLGAWTGWTYAASMAFALVYLGEHYAVDTLAGAALALLGWRMTALVHDSSSSSSAKYSSVQGEGVALRSAMVTTTASP